MKFIVYYTGYLTRQRAINKGHTVFYKKMIMELPLIKKDKLCSAIQLLFEIRAKLNKSRPKYYHKVTYY